MCVDRTMNEDDISVLLVCPLSDPHTHTHMSPGRRMLETELKDPGVAMVAVVSRRVAFKQFILSHTVQCL